MLKNKTLLLCKYVAQFILDPWLCHLPLVMFIARTSIKCRRLLCSLYVNVNSFLLDAPSGDGNEYVFQLATLQLSYLPASLLIMLCLALMLQQHRRGQAVGAIAGMPSPPPTSTLRPPPRTATEVL